MVNQFICLGLPDREYKITTVIRNIDQYTIFDTKQRPKKIESCSR